MSTQDKGEHTADVRNAVPPGIARLAVTGTSRTSTGRFEYAVESEQMLEWSRDARQRVHLRGPKMAQLALIRASFCRILYPQGCAWARLQLKPRRPCGCKRGGRSRFAVGRLRRRLWGLNGSTLSL